MQKRFIDLKIYKKMDQEELEQKLNEEKRGNRMSKQTVDRKKQKPNTHTHTHTQNIEIYSSFR